MAALDVWQVLIGGALLALVAGLIALANSPARGAPVMLLSPLPSATTAPTVMPTPGEGFPLNINIATADALQSLPGIGPDLAAAIITYREEYGPFELIEQIQKVDGIGPATFDAIQAMITVE